MSGGSLLPGSQRAIFSLYSHRAEGVRMFSRAFIRALAPFMRTPPTWPNHLPKALLLNTSTLGVRISTYKFCRDTNIQSIETTVMELA